MRKHFDACTENDAYSGSSAAELCDFPMKIRRFETQMVPAHNWPAALELENQRQQVGIHGSFVRLQTRGLAMKRCETVMHMHPIRELSATLAQDWKQNVTMTEASVCV